MAGLKRALLILALSIPASVVCAFVFVILVPLSLPPTDEAYGSSPRQMLSDPFVFGGAIVYGVVVGLISFPFVYITTRNRRLWKTAPFIFAVVLSEIILVTPLAGWGAFVGAFLALATALIVCRASGMGAAAVAPR
jgi:hypothetical protein